jgi:hypothetical protein
MKTICVIVISLLCFGVLYKWENVRTIAVAPKKNITVTDPAKLWKVKYKPEVFAAQKGKAAWKNQKTRSKK